MPTRIVYVVRFPDGSYARKAGERTRPGQLEHATIYHRRGAATRAARHVGRGEPEGTVIDSTLEVPDAYL